MTTPAFDDDGNDVARFRRHRRAGQDGAERRRLVSAAACLTRRCNAPKVAADPARRERPAACAR